MTIRPCTSADEMYAAFAPIWHYFGQLPPAPDALKHFARVIEPARVHAGYDGDAVVSGSGAFSFDFTVPGGQVKASGITIVGVLPTHRRRGYLTAMMRSQIDDARARGEPLAVLWATEETIYGRFGFGMASLAADIDLAHEHAGAFLKTEIQAEVRLVPLDEAEALILPIHERVARETPGMFARTSAWWQDRLLIDHPWRRQNGGALRCAVAHIDDKPVAYAFYRVNQTFDRGNFAGHILVVEALGDSPEATHAIWRFLLDIDLTARLKAQFLPVDHPLLLSSASPRRLNFILRDVLWARLVDVGAALSARSYVTDDAIVIDVADAFCSWNTGRWRVARRTAERTNAPADISCDVAQLGCVYLGGFTWAQLARSLRVNELRTGAIARADAMFRTDRAPWCPEVF